MTFAYEYPRAALAVDCVVFGLDEADLKVLLIQRKLPPFQHAWALPGGFVHVDETLDEAAQRELAEEAGVSDVYLRATSQLTGVYRELGLMAAPPEPEDEWTRQLRERLGGQR